MPCFPGSGFPFWDLETAVIGGFGDLEDSLGNFIAGTQCYNYSINSNTWKRVVFQNFLDSTSLGASFVFDKTAYFFGGYKTPPPNFTMYNNMWSFDASKYFTDTTTIGIAAIVPDVSFSVYPNPTESSKSFSISTSEKGEIIFYDELGQIINLVTLSKGVNQITLNTPHQVVMYKFSTSENEYKDGKIVIY
jgi:hypothetical protein